MAAMAKKKALIIVFSMYMSNTAGPTITNIRQTRPGMVILLNRERPFSFIWKKLVTGEPPGTYAQRGSRQHGYGHTAEHRIDVRADQNLKRTENETGKQKTEKGMP